MYVYLYIYISIFQICHFISKGSMNAESHGRNGSHRCTLSLNPIHTCNNLQCPSNMVDIGVLEELVIAMSGTSMRSVTDPKSGASPNTSSAPGFSQKGWLEVEPFLHNQMISTPGFFTSMPNCSKTSNLQNGIVTGIGFLKFMAFLQGVQDGSIPQVSITIFFGS